jgi:hypothetical protein
MSLAGSFVLFVSPRTVTDAYANLFDRIADGRDWGVQYRGHIGRQGSGSTKGLGMVSRRSRRRTPCSHSSTARRAPTP